MVLWELVGNIFFNFSDVCSLKSFIVGVFVLSKLVNFIIKFGFFVFYIFWESVVKDLLV